MGGHATARRHAPASQLVVVVAVSAKVTVTDHGMRDMVKRLREAGFVKVGVLESSGDDLVEIAAYNEFGTKDIPQRSFVRGTVDAQASEIKRLRSALSKQIVTGATLVPNALERLGAKVAAMIKQRMASSIPPPNAESTIDHKGSSTTLIDTGRLRRSITWMLER